jgi:hypothetical protein
MNRKEETQSVLDVDYDRLEDDSDEGEVATETGKTN